MDPAECLLVLGDQSRPSKISKKATHDSLKNEFQNQYPHQIHDAVPVVLQIWDNDWSYWVDIPTTDDITLVSGSKVRMIQRSNVGKRLGNLSQDSCAFFCCDMQERFRPAIAHFEDIVLVSKRLLDGAYALDIPVLVTEQYPKGLLKTVPELNITKANAVIEKTVFSMMVPEMENKLEELGNLQSVVLFGVEAHVCIQQTALDLLARGIEVHVVADATSSRSDVDRHIAFERLRSHGAIITTAETALLQLVKDKNHPKFKEIQGLIKATPPQNGLSSL